MAAQSAVADWPDDRARFVGFPIDMFEMAIAGSEAAVDAILGDGKLNARRVSTDYDLEGGD